MRAPSSCPTVEHWRMRRSVPIRDPWSSFSTGPDREDPARAADTVATQAGVRLIAPDRPGFGRSTVQARRTIMSWPADLESLADSLGLDSFGLLGESGGHAVRAGGRVTDALQGQGREPDGSDLAVGRERCAGGGEGADAGQLRARETCAVGAAPAAPTGRTAGTPRPRAFRRTSPRRSSSCRPAVLAARA